ncbi:mucin-5AC-like [Drosophila madeirensis]|uniref:Mucin-5AC-like n=1 Tax=Drosophila madeirensis TaxID=30013 RepID=A0AAU9FET3_DROMD
MEQSNGSRKHSLDQLEPPPPQAQSSVAASMPPLAESWSGKRKLYAIDEREESSPVTVGEVEAETAYDADVDELEQPVGQRDIIYELFQPWALTTYGDQAKTKTITLRKKARILKALEGKEHSRPDSSKFRFWVKTKGFTTNRPDGYEEAAGSRRRLKPLPASAVLSDNPGEVDLFAASTSKGFGRRIYRKVACVEEFFDIIYNVHMELGGRSGMHAGQKRTYRIITETYAFLPREAVTRFLTICPECKKNLRPSSPTGGCKDAELAGNESSSEVENYLNYSSHTESSLEAGPTAKRRRHSSADLKGSVPVAGVGAAASSCSATQLDVLGAPPPSPTAIQPRTQAAVETTPVSVPKIRVKTQLQRPLSPPGIVPRTEPAVSTSEQPNNPNPNPNANPNPMPSQGQPQSFNVQLLKSRDNLLQYYDFMRRFYASGSVLHEPVLAPPLYGSSLLQSLSFPTTTTTPAPTPTPAPTTTISTSTATTAAQSKSSAPPRASSPLPTTPSASITTFKTSPDSLSRARSPMASVATPTVPQVTHTPINLTKSLFCSPKNSNPASTSTPVAVQAPLKLELPSPPRSLPELRIPQLRGMPHVELSLPLPPLDLERLKPITSTYLQLTRSMGLSDEDALRFDNLFLFSLTCLAYKCNATNAMLTSERDTDSERVLSEQQSLL